MTSIKTEEKLTEDRDCKELPAVVIEKILTYLPARDLSSCAIVSKTWDRIVTVIKIRRNGVVVFTEVCNYDIETCNLDDESNLGERVLRRLHQSFIEPYLVMLFATTDRRLGCCNGFPDSFWTPHKSLNQRSSKSAEGPSTGIVERKKVITRLERYLPVNCHIVGCSMQSRAPLWKEHVRKAVTCVTIPSIPGVKVHQLSTFGFTGGRYEWPTSIKTFITNGLLDPRYKPFVKCVVAFGNTLDSDYKSNHFSRYLKQLYSDDLCFVVGRLHSEDAPMLESEVLPEGWKNLEATDRYAGIAFYGKSIEVQRLRLKEDLHRVKDQLLYLSDIISGYKNGVAFLYTQIESYYDSNYDSRFHYIYTVSDMFRHMFPNVALLSINCKKIFFSKEKPKFLKKLGICRSRPKYVIREASCVLLCLLFEE